MSNIPSRYDWSLDFDFSDFNKETLKKMYIENFLRKTQQMFEYEGLPETIPKRDLELIVQTCGAATWAKGPDGKLYVFRAGYGGVPNVYYRPTIAVIANPALNFNASLKIDEECVIMPNDALWRGIMVIIEAYSYLLAECDLSFKFAAINSRVHFIINALNEDDAESARTFIEDIINGEKLGIIESDNFLEGEGNDSLKVFNAQGSNQIVQHLIELRQYIYGVSHQELGIQSQFNMKREAINEAEAALQVDVLFPLIDDMLEQRKLALEKVNKIFGTNISVKLSSAWEALRANKTLSQDLIKSEIDANLNNDEVGDSNE